MQSKYLCVYSTYNTFKGSGKFQSATHIAWIARDHEPPGLEFPPGYINQK